MLVDYPFFEGSFPPEKINIEDPPSSLCAGEYSIFESNIENDTRMNSTH